MPNKFRAFVAGFGSGKTYVGCMDIAKHFCEHPRVDQGYFAPTYPHIRDIFYPTIEEVAHSFGFKVRIKTTDKEVEFFRGSIYYGNVICRSLDNPDMIIGFKIGNGLIDEFDLLPTDKARLAWRKIIARLRWPTDGVKNGIAVTTTPEGFRATYQIFSEDIQRRPALSTNYGLVQASTYDNEANLPDDYIPSLIEAYPQELIDAYLNGKFVNLKSGTVYRAYNRRAHTTDATITEKEPLRIGMDFNVGNMSAAVYVVRNGTWHAVEELTGIFDTPAMIGTIKNKYPQHNIRVYPDASGASRKTVNASTSDIALLSQSGFGVLVNASNPLVKDRVLATNLAFERGRLLVNDKKCPTLAKCFEQLAYDENGMPDKRSGLDHLPDAATYPIVHEMPIVFEHSSTSKFGG